MKIILDSNALMMPFQYGLNIDIELEKIVGIAEIYVPSCVFGELEKIAKKRKEAKAALQLAKKYRIIEVNGFGDDGVIEAAKKLNAIVVTNDRELIRRLRKEKLGVIFMKQNHLVMQND